MTEKAVDKPDFLTIAEFCAETRISPRHYYRLRAAGNGPDVTHLGGRQVIKRSELLRWVNDRTENRYLQIR